MPCHLGICTVLVFMALGSLVRSPFQPGTSPAIWFASPAVLDVQCISEGRSASKLQEPDPDICHDPSLGPDESEGWPGMTPSTTTRYIVVAPCNENHPRQGACLLGLCQALDRGVSNSWFLLLFLCVCCHVCGAREST